jgi:type I restriction enzyme R subunit
MPRFTEKSSVEDFIVQRLVEGKGWTFVPADSLERESYEEPLLVKNLVKAIKRINGRRMELSESDVGKVLIELRHRSASAEGVKDILNFMKLGVPVKLEKSRELRFVDLFDYKEIGNNEFIVSRQVKYEKGNLNRRPDIVLYVNGIPLVVIECKNPADPSVSWWDAFLQVRGYEKDVPEPFKYVQFSIAAEETARYFPNCPWSDKSKTYIWRAEDFDVLEGTLEMLNKETLLDLVKNFIFMREERGSAKKVIARYMQYRAANKIFRRVVDNLQGKEERNKGLIWHWQGSGKTLTMIFAAHKLYREGILENPTIFFIVDRLDLEEQLKDELNSIDIWFKPEVIESIKDLKEVLSHDGGRGKRGIFLTLIHKFRPSEISEFEEGISKIENKETIATRKNIVCFIDEGHRTQYGTLGAQRKSLLRNAFVFAFTGTPIDKKGRNTFQEFSYAQLGETYLDKYFMDDSVKDKFTVKIVYEPRMEKKVHLNKERLEFFFEQDMEEIPEEFREGVEKKIKEKMGKIKLIMKNPQRIEAISRDIAEHFKQNVDGKFKAMVVAVDREACLSYKKMLDKFLPPEYSEIIMTFGVKDSQKLKNYQEELRKRYNGKDMQEIYKEIVDKFKKDNELPKILIVTDMLITGFDAPILQTMYLDKPLKEHRLLQTIARTNRPYMSQKEAGLILDYVGVFKELEKALANYNKEDVKNVAQNIEEEAKEFENLVQKLLGIFEGVTKGAERENLMAAITILSKDENKAKSFRREYRELRKKYEFLGPHEIKLVHLGSYDWLTAVYHAYNRHVKREEPDEREEYARKFFSRTIDNVYKSIDIGKIRKDFPILEIDEGYLKNLEKTYSDMETRVSDMVFALHKYVLVDKARTPKYESLAGKVERIVRDWRERKVKITELYKDASQIIKQLNDIERRNKELGVSEKTYSVILLMESTLGKSDNLINEIKGLTGEIEKASFKGWSIQPTALKEVGIIVRKYLRKKNISKEKRDELHEKIVKIIKEFD